MIVSASDLFPVSNFRVQAEESVNSCSFYV